MGCEGCIEEKRYDMRFIGFKDRKLIPTAPSGYEQGEVHNLPLHMADLDYWELADKIPDLVIPESRYEDSVYIEESFVPEEDHGKDASEEEIQLTLVPEEAPEEEVSEEPIPKEIPEEQEAPEDYSKLTVEELKERIIALGGEVKSHWLKAGLITELERLSSPP